MAEIKSTMEMVLERAAQMERDAAEAAPLDYSKDGMRLAAAYMNRSSNELREPLTAAPVEQQSSMIKGALQILFRNVLLPRDPDSQESSKRALEAILTLNGSEEAQGICGELQQILEQYEQHKVQMTEQLEGALRSQLQQQQAMQGGGDPQNINPATHPQYAAEMSKMLGDLNDQYSQAIDQRKEMLGQLFQG